MLYDDPFGIDVIRVHFPLGNFYSVDVKVNLSRGTECGFFRSGFSYYKVEGQSEQATTLIAVVGDREVYKFGCYSFSWILTHDTPIDFRKFSSGYLDGKCFGEQKRLQPARHASTI